MSTSIAHTTYVGLVAHAAGLSVSRIRQLECQRHVRPATATRYLDALKVAWTRREFEARLDLTDLEAERASNFASALALEVGNR